MLKRSDGRWQEQMTVTVNGKKKIKYFYGKTKAEVLRKMQEFKTTKENGVTFGFVAEEWWEKHESKIAYNTTKGYRPALKRAEEEFGEEYIKDIKPFQIANSISDFAATHAYKTVKTQLLIYNLIFKYAVEKGHIDINPAAELSVPTNLPKNKIPCPSKDDINKIKESVKCTFGLFAYMAMYTGLRKGELLALTWEDVSIEKRYISVTKSLYHESNKPKIKKPKTETSVGAVPVVDALLKVLKPGKGLIFKNKYGTHLSETQFQRQWELYTQQSGVTCTPHQLRHAYATMLFEANVPAEQAQALLRHAQISTTMDIYTELREQRRKEIFESVYSVDIV